MNLLIITSLYPNRFEPTKGLFNHHLIRALSVSHNLAVVSPISWITQMRFRSRTSPSTTEWSTTSPQHVNVNYPFYYYTPKVFRSLYGTFFWMSVARTIRTLLKSNMPDVVLGFWAHPDGEAAVRAAHEAGVPSVIVVGGSDVLLLTKDKARLRRIRNVLTAADLVVAVSSDLKHKVVELGVPSHKVYVWSRGIDPTLFSLGNRDDSRRRLGLLEKGRAIVWVGRMVPIKGLDVLLDSCSLLHDRGVDYHLYLVGDGPLRKQLTAQTEARGLSEKITFVGPKGHDELPDWYRAADLTVLPSRSEGLPNVLRESLACGTPFVASDVGGISEIAEPNSSILIPPDNPVALSDAIEHGLARWAGNTESIPLRSQSWNESARLLVDVMQPYVTSRSLTTT